MQTNLNEKDNKPERLASKTIKGSAYSIGASAVTMVLGFGRSILMARLIGPEDYGVVTFAMTFLNFTIPLRDFGLDQALIHRKPDKNTTSDQILEVHFSLRLILIVFFLILLLAAAPILRYVYPQKTLLVPVLMVLTIGEIARTLGSTQTTCLQKNMRFKELAILQIWTSISMTVIGPLMAWQGWGIWALVGERISGTIISTLAMWIFIKPCQLRWSLDLDLVKWYLGYGRFIFVSRLLAPVTDQFDEFWIGSTSGSTALGYYTKAYEFAQYSRRVISDPISKVFFSTFAQAQDDRSRLSKAFFRASSLATRVGFLIIGAFVLVTKEFVLLFIGDVWLPMALTFQLMVVYSLLAPLSAIASNLVNATGHPVWNTQKRIAQVAFFVPAVIIGNQLWGINGVALAADAMLLIGLVIIFHRARRLVDLSFRRMLLYPALGLAVGVSASLLTTTSLTINGNFSQMIAKLITYTAGYSLILFIFERNQYSKHIYTFYNLLIGNNFSKRKEET